MEGARQYQLEVIEPYRKKLKSGDVFAMKFVDQFGDKLFVHGRVINTEAYWTPSGKDAGLANLVYIYDQTSSQQDQFDASKFAPGNLLTPPELTNRLGWSRGYFYTVGNIPLTAEDLLPRQVFKSSNRPNLYYDDARREVDGWDGPTGAYGLASYRAIQMVVSNALGLADKNS